MTTDDILKDHWHEAFPGDPWPGSGGSAVVVMVAEIRALRLLTETMTSQVLKAEENYQHPMRSREEIQRAHDLITQLLLHEVVLKQAVKPSQAAVLIFYAETLCWVLRHDHNKSFAENLEAVEMRLALLGFEVLRFPTIQYPGGKDPAKS